MRVIHLLNHSRIANGHVEVTVDLACDQARLGHEVFYAAGPGDFAGKLANHGVSFLELPAGGGMLGTLAVMSAFTRICRNVRPDIVHAHMVTSAVLARIVQPFCGYRLITTVHNSFDRQSGLMGAGNLVIAVSDAVRREMQQKGVPERKLRMVHNGTINGARRAAFPEEVMTLARPAVVTVAGLHPRKGVDTLIEAIAQVRDSGLDVHLYVVGGGPQYAELEQFAAGTGHGDAIHLMGYMSDPRAVLGGADVFVLASLAEPCGLALIEARQMGCACIASNVGGNPEVIDFGNSGRLFTPGKSAELAAVLYDVLMDKDELVRLRLAARAGWQHWTVERMARETLEVYEEALAFSHRQAGVRVSERV